MTGSGRERRGDNVGTAQGARSKAENKQAESESSANIVIIGNTAESFAHIIDAWLPNTYVQGKKWS